MRPSGAVDSFGQAPTVTATAGAIAIGTAADRAAGVGLGGATSGGLAGSVAGSVAIAHGAVPEGVASVEPRIATRPNPAAAAGASRAGSASGAASVGAAPEAAGSIGSRAAIGAIGSRGALDPEPAGGPASGATGCGSGGASTITGGASTITGGASTIGGGGAATVALASEPVDWTAVSADVMGGRIAASTELVVAARQAVGGGVGS